MDRTLIEFEKEFADYNNVKYAVSVNSGTAALDVALRYFKLQAEKSLFQQTLLFQHLTRFFLLAANRFLQT